jgi:hypothetical protein
VDVIFSAWSTPVALATKKAKSTIPIVFAGVGDAVGVGLVAQAERLSAARVFIERFPAATEILIVAASRDAADDLTRRITLTRGRDIRTSPGEFCAARRAAGHGGHGAARLSGILPHGRTRYPTVRRQLASKTSIFGPIAAWHRGCLLRNRPTDF